MKHTKSYIKGYPRPQFSRTNWLNLNGNWNFLFDDENIGEIKGWYKEFPEAKIINVPYSYHTKNSGINDQTPHSILWYNRKLCISEEHLKSKCILHFEAVDYECKLYVNGKYIGKHIGGYNRFSFDISNYLIIGDNDITLRIYDDFSTTKPRGKQRWKDHNYECWYIETSGIWKTVWCEFVSDTYLTSTKFSTNFDNDTLKIDYTLNGNITDISVETIISFNENIISHTSFFPTRNHFSNTINLVDESQIFKLFLWSYHTPNLYDVKFIIKYKNKVIDEVLSYFGVRKIECENNQIKINNNPTYLKMVLDQGYWMDGHLTATEEELLNDVSLIKELGFNGVRKHEKIESELFLYYCDILGLYVWLEMPSPYEFSDLTISNYTQEWIESVSQYHNHTSIITWVPFNESWGIFRVQNNIKQQAFTESIYYLTKSLDDSRPVISNDGWEHTKSDIITLHNYSAFGNELQACYEDIDSILKNKHVENMPPKSAFAHNYQYNNQPLMLSEFAGIALKREEGQGWGYGLSEHSEENFIKRLTSLMNAIKNMPFFSGYCITQLTDVQQEINGLLNEDRSQKISVEKIRQLNDMFKC